MPVMSLKVMSRHRQAHNRLKCAAPGLCGGGDGGGGGGGGGGVHTPPPDTSRSCRAPAAPGARSEFKNDHFTEKCGGSEAGSLVFGV